MSVQSTKKSHPLSHIMTVGNMRNRASFFGPAASAQIRKSLPPNADDQSLRTLAKRAISIATAMNQTLVAEDRYYKELAETVKIIAVIYPSLRALQTLLASKEENAFFFYAAQDEGTQAQLQELDDDDDVHMAIAVLSGPIVNFRSRLDEFLPYFERTRKRMETALKKHEASRKKMKKSGPLPTSAFQNAVDALRDAWKEHLGSNIPRGVFRNFVHATLLPVSPPKKKSYLLQINHSLKQ